MSGNIIVTEHKYEPGKTNGYGFGAHTYYYLQWRIRKTELKLFHMLIDAGEEMQAAMAFPDLWIEYKKREGNLYEKVLYRCIKRLPLLIMRIWIECETYVNKLSQCHRNG